MDPEKIAKYKERISPLLEKLKEKYSKELDDKIILLLKEAEENGLSIKRDFEDEFKRYYKIVNPYIEKISTRKPPNKRKEKINRYEQILDFLIEEFEKGYSKEVERKIISAFEEAKKEGIDPKKYLLGKSERFRLLSQIYEGKIGRA